MVNPRVKTAQLRHWDDREYSITVKMAPLSVSILKYVPYTEEELQKKKEALAKKTVKKETVKKTTETKKTTAAKKTKKD